MISTKVLAGILRACADAIENNGYQGEQNLSTARLLCGIPAQLDMTAKAVHAHYQALTKDPAPSTDGQEKELTPEAVEARAHATVAALGVTIPKEKKPKPLRTITKEYLAALVRKSLRVKGASTYADLHWKMSRLKSEYEAAQRDWLDALRPGDIVEYHNWHYPAEIVSIAEGSSIHDMQVRNLGDGTKGNAWASVIAPYDERHAARLTNYHRMRAIEKGLEDAAEDDRVLEALEAVLKK